MVSFCLRWKIGLVFFYFPPCPEIGFGPFCLRFPYSVHNKNKDFIPTEPIKSLEKKGKLSKKPFWFRGMIFGNYNRKFSLAERILREFFRFRGKMLLTEKRTEKRAEKCTERGTMHRKTECCHQSFSPNFRCVFFQQ